MERNTDMTGNMPGNGMAVNNMTAGTEHEEDGLLDVGRLWPLFRGNLRWFALSACLCVLAGTCYIVLSRPSCEVTGKMRIIDKSRQGGGMSAGLAMLSSLPLGLGSSLGSSLGASATADTEREVLTSSLLVREVVNDLGLHTEHRLCGLGRSRLLYGDEPVRVTPGASCLGWLESGGPATFRQLEVTVRRSGEGYRVEGVMKENKEDTALPGATFSTLPAEYRTPAGVLTLSENGLLTGEERAAYGGSYRMEVRVSSPLDAANGFIERLSVEPPSKKVTNILALTLTDERAERGVDFVDRMVEVYNRMANAEKNEEARRMEEFVNGRLALVDAELGSSDAAWEASKTRFQVTDPSVDAAEVMGKKSEYEGQLVSIGTQLQLQDYLSEYVRDASNLFEPVPVNVLTYGGNAVPVIEEHNALAVQRKELLRSSSERAPQVERLTRAIEELHPSILTAMDRDREALLIRKRTVEREYDRYMGRVTSVPSQERALTEIGREREIRQGVYLLLLQKREEAAMELASVTDKGRLIDETQVVPRSARPKKKVVLAGSLLAGLVLPFGVLLLLGMLRDRVETTGDIESLGLPVLGEIPGEAGDTGIQDAFRSLRSRLLLRAGGGRGVVLVTSGEQGEGNGDDNDRGTVRLDCAMGLAESLARAGRRVSLCVLDTVTAKDTDITGTADMRALLSDEDMTMEDIEVMTVHAQSGVDVLAGGRDMNEKPYTRDGRDRTDSGIALSDLLAGPGTGRLLGLLRGGYDHVVVSGPALGDTGDALAVGRLSDVTLLVCGAAVTCRDTVREVVRLSDEGVLPGACAVLTHGNNRKTAKGKVTGNGKVTGKGRRGILGMLPVLPLLAACLMLLASCGSARDVAYFEKGLAERVVAAHPYDARIMPKDVLTVTVSTVDPQAAVPFNLTVPTVQSQGQSATTMSQPVLQSYLVENDGAIEFPVVGRIVVGGLTKAAAEKAILERIRPYLSESEHPIVTVRMSSYSVSVLGEVNRPGSFTVSREKISVLEALAQAGDMTIHGVREKVRLIREDAEGRKEMHTLDLTDAGVVDSPYYYLQQNDVLYVEPSEVKKKDAKIGQMTSLWLSATGILISVASLVVNILR
ncbi:MAG: polysaccharide biosynthesis/export family protein [Prevotella sp.]|nr:polysaccharide biosynthesis/export family protein [Prevotella sp.]